jgi:DNA replication ATP-dependent helicase Dna2
MIKKSNETSQELTALMAVSDLSKYYQYNCDKLLKLISEQDIKRQKRLLETGKDGKEKKKKYVPKMDNSTLREALRHRGAEFESNIKDKLHNVVDCRDMLPDENKNLLRRVEIGQTLYQVKFDVPEEFYEEMGIKGVKLKAFIPDFIEVREEDGEKKLMIYDAKASKDARVPHQVQNVIYYYYYFIQNVIEL